MAETDPTTEQGNEIPDALGMSDEDFANMDPADFEQDFQEETAEDDQDLATEDDADESDENSSHDPMNEGEEDQGSDDEEDADAAAEASDSEEEEPGEDEDDTDGDTDTEDDEDLDDTDTDNEDAEQEDDADTDDESEDDKDQDEIDYKAEYEKLMAPFKANGHEMTVKNADEVRRLMQMGANYNKKMAALKPSLKTVKLLDKHGLNDESKLSHLIDLSRGDKGAIQKLLKDHGVDPMDFDADEESDYRPNTYTVDDREVELDEVLDSLQDTPTYSEVVDLISNKWDDASKQIIANSPRVLEVLNDQMANGVYERVSTEVERLRAFGQLSGVSDIEAYKMTGDRMAAEGAFDDLAPQQRDNQQEQKRTESKPATRRARTKKPDPKLKQKKRAASSTKTKPASKAPTDFNPLGMSDEEFEKQFDSNLL